MSEHDEKLEQKLNALDDGMPVNQLVENGNNNSNETGELVRLAAAIRDLPHPVRSPENVHADKRRIVSIAQQKHASVVGKKKSKSSFVNSRWLFVPVFGGLALILLMSCIVAAGAGYYLWGPIEAHRVTLSDVTGKVQVAAIDSDNSLRLVSNGERIGPGHRIVTGDDSWVTLNFFDGSHAVLSPHTDLALDQIDGDWGNVLRVKLTQSSGFTAHQVVPLRGENSDYKVATPTGAASVKGTKFNVQVDGTGLSAFKVETGAVVVTNEKSQEIVLSGQGIISEPGKPLPKPDFLFILQGVLEAKENNVWHVSGVEISLRGGTRISGNPQIGDFILVSGYIKKGNEWIADTIQPAFTDDHGGAFTGRLNSIDGDQWNIGGIEVVVESGTPGSDLINVGDMVRVTFEILPDGTWLALGVETLQDVPEEPGPLPPIDPETHPELSFEPDEVEGVGCSQDYTLSGILLNEAHDPKDIAVDVQLGFNIVKGRDYVDQVTMFPSSWEEILPEKSKVFDVKVTMKDDWMKAAGESEVKVQIYVVQKVNWPEQRSRVTMTIISDCQGVLPTEEPPDDDEETPEEDSDTCTGADPHPKGSRLADEYGVDYGKLMTWFCKYNLGFGEIELMLGLSEKYGVPVEEILEMRIDIGLGWGQIKQTLAEQYGSEFKNKGKSEQNKNKEKPNNKKDK